MSEKSSKYQLINQKLQKFPTCASSACSPASHSSANPEVDDGSKDAVADEVVVREMLPAKS